MSAVIVRMQAAAWRMGARLRRQEGQTSSEYLVIAGVVVIAIVGILSLFHDQLNNAAQAIGKNIMDAVK